MSSALMPAKSSLMGKGSDMGARTLAFEIGTEEIPAFDLKDATAKLAGMMSAALDAARIPHGEVKVLSTPRRLDVVVSDVAEATEAIQEEHKGPSVAIAYDADGAPTKAASGFARGKGLDASDLEVRDVDGVEYVFAVVSVPSVSTTELLPEVLRGIIDSISWPKSMRWNTHRELFTRPVRWIAALFGEDVIPLKYAGLESGRSTWGHRVLSPGAHDVACADELEGVIRSLSIVPTETEREQIIRDGVKAAEADNPGCNVVIPEKTLAEVVNLSEHPTVLVGSFDERFLEVPEEIIVDAMLMHQRYFPMYRDGKLTNRFIIISNGDPEFSADIIDGNERVVAARLYDARFFYMEDLKTPLESYVDRLDEVVFQEKLGTMRDKTLRIERLSAGICADAGCTEGEAGDVARAAKLAKADLVTNAVIEFTSVQGIMGSYYASASGESDVVATAIAQHYRPRFSGDEVPESIVGKIVALADKMDTICGLFALGQGPTGSADPFALRRAALGVIAILGSGVDVMLEKIIAGSLKIYQEAGIEFDFSEIAAAIEDFFVTRTRVLLKDSGHDIRVVDAVIAADVAEPIAIIERTKALTEAIKGSPETFDDLSTAFSRAVNLRNESLGSDFDESLFNDDESALAAAIDEVGSEVEVALGARDYSKALESLSKLRGPIDAFFESTMVMDEDAALRENRIKLLNGLVDAFAGIADFSMISRKNKI